MPKNICLMIAVAILPFSAMAENSPFYGRLDTGYSWSTDMDKDIGTDAGSSFIAGAGIGYRINDHFRTDLTIGYRGSYQVDSSTTVLGSTLNGKADIKSTVGLLNAYYDIGHYDRFTPYIGGGVGIASTKVDSTDLTLAGTGIGSIGSHTDTNFAWQLGVGTAISVTQDIDIDIGYRYLDMGTVKTGDGAIIGGTAITGATLEGNLRASEVQVGLRIAF